MQKNILHGAVIASRPRGGAYTFDLTNSKPMKTEKNQLPLRNVYENLALMLFMLVLLIVSLLNKAGAMMN